MRYDLIIIGSGAAGLSAAIYAKRYTLQTLVIEGDFGGETATAGLIENYPGFKEIDGYELVKNMREQAKATGAIFQSGWAKTIEKKEDFFIVKTEDKEFEGRSVVLAIGAKRRHLGLANETELTGKGLHYCVTCDGPLYSKKTIAMVGGGDSSVKGVNFLAEYAEKIYFITREKEITAEPANYGRMEKLIGTKIEILKETEIKELVGGKKLEKVKLSKTHHDSDELALDGMFIEVGFDPDITFAKQLGIELDEKGYMKTDVMTRTNVPGVFVAGDSTNHFGGFKQDITAAALGSVAATATYEYLKNNN